MLFSQRIGKKPVKNIIQIDSMDHDLRVTLWNALESLYVRSLVGEPYFEMSREAGFIRKLWFHFFKLPVDEIPQRTGGVAGVLKQWFFKSEWYEVYDFIETVPSLDRENRAAEAIKLFNKVFEEEVSGYRFIDGHITPITDENELNEIKETLATSGKTKLSGVQEHISAAIEKLARKKNPDYRNSIKESISAVESIARLISGKPKAELGAALNLIEKRIGLHLALKKGFLAIYGYTSDEGGIRHALLEESQVSFEDAKFMLVSCCAFINYLIAKASKMGIELKES